MLMVKSSKSVRNSRESFGLCKTYLEVVGIISHPVLVARHTPTDNALAIEAISQPTCLISLLQGSDFAIGLIGSAHYLNW